MWGRAARVQAVRGSGFSRDGFSRKASSRLKSLPQKKHAGMNNPDFIEVYEGALDAAFCRDLFAEEHVTVVPGSYLSREVDGFNPGAGRVRMALVAPLAECVEAAGRIRAFIERRT